MNRFRLWRSMTVAAAFVAAFLLPGGGAFGAGGEARPGLSGEGGCIGPAEAIAAVRADLPRARIERFEGQAALAFLRQKVREFMGLTLRQGDAALLFDARRGGEQATAVYWLILFKDGCAIGQGAIPLQIWQAMTTGRGI